MTTTITLTLPENTVEDLQAVASGKPLGEYLTAHAAEALRPAARDEYLARLFSGIFAGAEKGGAA